MRGRTFAATATTGEAMLPAPTLDDFLRQPVGRYWGGEQMVVWAATSSLIGVAFCGAPTPEVLDALLCCLDAPVPADVLAHCHVVFDVRRVVSLDGALFDRLLGALRERRSLLEQRVARCVIVRPEGFIGALASGVSALLWRCESTTVVDSMERALATLELPAATSTRLRALDGVVDAMSAQSSILDRLRRWLTAHPKEHRIRVAASALGSSQRSLQRALAIAGTSFKKESDRIRAAQARHWLSRANEKIEVIGRQLGFANESSFRSFIRRQTGHSPRQLRPQTPLRSRGMRETLRAGSAAGS